MLKVVPMDNQGPKTEVDGFGVCVGVVVEGLDNIYKYCCNGPCSSIIHYKTKKIAKFWSGVNAILKKINIWCKSNKLNTMLCCLSLFYQLIKKN